MVFQDTNKEVTFMEYLKTQQNVAPKGTKNEDLATLRKIYNTCQSCELSTQGRTQVVFGTGNPDAKLLFIGEAPGRQEDLEGTPFVGRAGQLLNKIIAAMQLKRTDVYLTNTAKCRPKNNANPPFNAINTCKKLLLFKEISIVQPKIICTLGAVALRALLGQNTRLSHERGLSRQLQQFTLVPTYHPAYLLRNPSAKKLVWQDMQKIMKILF